jgi:hypothetical protein
MKKKFQNGLRRSLLIGQLPMWEVHEWSNRAKTILDEMLSVGDFNDDDLDMRLVQNDICGVAEIGLIPYIIKRGDVHRFKGLQEEELRGSAEGFDLLDLLMDLKKPDNGHLLHLSFSLMPEGTIDSRNRTTRTQHYAISISSNY